MTPSGSPSSRLTLGPRGSALIKSYEQLRLTAYLPTPHDVPTIGFGSTRDVRMGMSITRDEAESRFRADVESSVIVVASLPVRLTPAMFDALVSLVFNVGPGAVSPSSTIGNSLRRTDVDPRYYYTAWSGFALWRKQAGRDLLGLARRRAEEMALYLADGLP